MQHYPKDGCWFPGGRLFVSPQPQSPSTSKSTKRIRFPEQNLPLQEGTKPGIPFPPNEEAVLPAHSRRNKARLQKEPTAMETMQIKSHSV